MKISVEEALRKHCSCTRSENKIIIEAVTVCPECFTFFSTVVAKIPNDRIPEVLSRITEVLEEMGLLGEAESIVVEEPRGG